MKNFICENCGKEFESRKSTAHFCSRVCYNASRPVAQRPCAGCGRVFTPKKYRDRLCDRCIAESDTLLFDLKLERLMKPLAQMTGEELLSYGKISHMRQLQQMRAQKFCGR